MPNATRRRLPPGADATTTFTHLHLRRTLNGAPANHARALERAHREFGYRFAHPHLRRDELAWLRSYGYDSQQVDWYRIALAIAPFDRVHHPQHREVVAEDVCVLHLDLELAEVA